MFQKNFYSYLSNHRLIGIKGGLTRPSFLEIWMVVVNERVFARSWNKSERSWFTEFQIQGIGEVKFGDKIIKVKGKKVSAEDPIQLKISEAYLKKYNQPENLRYSKGISQPEYFNYTMEFLNLNSKEP